MTWVSFVDEAAFHVFHNIACADHNIPLPGRNAATDEIMIDAQWTTAYVVPIDDHGVIKANVSDEDVLLYVLTPTEAPIIVYDEDGLTIIDGPTSVTFQYHKDPGERLHEFTQGGDE